jgi:hypothetical protein
MKYGQKNVLVVSKSVNIIGVNIEVEYFENKTYYDPNKIPRDYCTGC